MHYKCIENNIYSGFGMKILKSIILSFLLFIMVASCHKKEPCPDDFIVYGQVVPYSSRYKIGDTIHLLVKTDMHAIKARNINKYYSFDSLILHSGLTIYRIDTPATDFYSRLTDFVDTIDDPLFNYEIYTHEDSSSNLSFASIIDNDSIYASVKIVLKSEGLYILHFGVYHNWAVKCGINYLFYDPCDLKFFSLTTQLNPGQDNNFDLLKESPNDHFSKWMTADPKRNFYDKSGFAYRVIK